MFVPNSLFAGSGGLRGGKAGENNGETYTHAYTAIVCIRTVTGSFSEFLNLLELRGASWCNVEFGAPGGFSILQNEVMFFYAALEGAVRIAGVTGGTIHMEPGDITIILSGEAHAVRNQPDARTDVIEYLNDGKYSDSPATFTIGGEEQISARVLCGRLKVRWPSGLVRRSLPALVTIAASEALISSASLEKARMGSGSAALLTRIASLSLTAALRSDPQCEQLFLSSASNDPIARALQLIERHPHQPWTVYTLAKAVGMGRSNFAARFSAEVGRTPIEMLAEQRMRLAAELLKTGELKIIEVGSRVGYRSEAAFSRCFTRLVGISPGQVRSQAKHLLQHGTAG
jgi:AraC-like DNA-binding protein